MVSKTVKSVEEIGRFLRSEWFRDGSFEGWPGLPMKAGQEPSLEQANLFFLGCCVDFMTLTRVAWDNARHFCTETVPVEWQPRMWEWIARHTQTEWEAKRLEYRLHRFPARHMRIHEIARGIVEHFGGDPRNIWQSRTKSLLEILESDLRVGPAIARMIVGGLRDHKLVTLTRSDFKPDRHVIRLMKELGLAPRATAQDALNSANHLFRDPWLADTCFYHLGADYGVKTREQFWSIHQAIEDWKRLRDGVRARFVSVLKELIREPKNGKWRVYSDHSPHWAGGYLVKEDGPLAEAMNSDSLWAWIGIGFDGALSVGLDVGGSGHYFEGAAQRQLSREGLSDLRQTQPTAKGDREFWGAKPLRMNDLNESGLRTVLQGALGSLRRVVAHL